MVGLNDLRGLFQPMILWFYDPCSELTFLNKWHPATPAAWSIALACVACVCGRTVASLPSFKIAKMYFCMQKKRVHSILKRLSGAGLLCSVKTTTAWLVIG